MIGNNLNRNFVPFVVFGKYDFKAEECDEITFKRGDPILVLEKDDEHKDGWWKGKTVNKAIGLFPVEFTTFVNIKQINIEGLFEELDNSISRRRESIRTNTSSIITNYNLQVPGNTSPHPSLIDVHTPKINYIDHEINSAASSPSYYSNRMSMSSASGIANISPQVIQSSVHQMPPHLSIGNAAINRQKEYQVLPPTSWSVDNVIDWLEDIGFSACSQIFRDNNINGIKLLDQSLATLRELGISQLKDRLKLFNSIVTLKERYIQLNQGKEMNTSIVNEPSRQWEQHDSLYNRKYTIKEEEGSVINDDSISISSALSNNQRRNEYINSARQISGPAGMRPHINSIVSHDNLPLTNTNFNYYRSSQRVNYAPSQTSKSSISSITSFFKKLSFSKSSNKKNSLMFEPMFQQADYQGWLWTRFDKSSKWKKRWIILSKEKLYFLKEPKHPINIKHTIQLNITFSIQPDIHKGKTKYTFNLIDSANQKITYFSADNHLVMMTWINVLVRATTNSTSKLQSYSTESNISPVLLPQSIIVPSPIPSTGIPPIYGVNPPIISSPPLSPNSNPSYNLQQLPSQQQTQQQKRSSKILRNSNYIQNPGMNIVMPQGMVSPRIQQSIISPQILPNQVKRTSIVVNSPSLQSQRPRQPSNPQTPIGSIISTSEPPIIIENKE